MKKIYIYIFFSNANGKEKEMPRRMCRAGSGYFTSCAGSRGKKLVYWKSWDSSCLDCSGRKAWVQRAPAAIDVGQRLQVPTASPWAAVPQHVWAVSDACSSACNALRALPWSASQEHSWGAWPTLLFSSWKSPRLDVVNAKQQVEKRGALGKTEADVRAAFPGASFV